MKQAAMFGVAIVSMALASAPGFAGAADTSKTKSTTQEAKSAVSDSWVTAKTKIALFSDDRVKGSQIKVTTNSGIVTLNGKVDSSEAKSAATEIAKGIEGATEVKNELQVVSPSSRKAVEADDKEITKQVQDRFSKDSRLKSAKIDVRTDKGVVVLSGQVPTIDLSARASEIAREIPGVRSVKNDLVYESRSSSLKSTR